MTSDDLGPGVILSVNDSALLVVDLLLLLVAQQEDDGAEEEDGRAPANAVGPSEFPQGAVSKFKFLHEENWIQDEGDQDGDQCKGHDPDGDAVVARLDCGVVVVEPQSRHEGCEDVQQEADHTQGGAGHDVGFIPGLVASRVGVDLERQGLGRARLHTVVEEALAPTHRQQPVGRGER